MPPLYGKVFLDVAANPGAPIAEVAAKHGISEKGVNNIVAAVREFAGRKRGQEGISTKTENSRVNRATADSNGFSFEEATDSPSHVYGERYERIPEHELRVWERIARDDAAAAAGKPGSQNITAVYLPTGREEDHSPLGRRWIRFQREFEKISRKRVVIVRSLDGSPLGFDAFNSPNARNTIVVNADAIHGFSYLLGHEFGHSLQAQHPDIYAKLVEELKALAPDWKTYADRLADFGYKTEAEREAEFINDFIGSQFGEAAFWKMLQARNASLFHRVATLAWEFLKELGGRIAGMPRDVRPYFQDIEAARNAVAEAIEAYLLTGEFPDRVLADSADADLARGFGPQSSSRTREPKTKAHRDQWGALPKKGNDTLTPNQNFERLKTALEWAARKRKGIIGGAWHPELGRIDLPWGRPGHNFPTRSNDPRSTHTDGYGLSHILAKHGEEAMREIPSIIAYGKLHPHDNDPLKHLLTYKKHLIVVQKENMGATYAITAYNPNETYSPTHKTPRTLNTTEWVSNLRKKRNSRAWNRAKKTYKKVG